MLGLRGAGRLRLAEGGLLLGAVELAVGQVVLVSHREPRFTVLLMRPA